MRLQFRPNQLHQNIAKNTLEQFTFQTKNLKRNQFIQWGATIPQTYQYPSLASADKKNTVDQGTLTKIKMIFFVHAVLKYELCFFVYD